MCACLCVTLRAHVCLFVDLCVRVCVRVSEKRARSCKDSICFLLRSQTSLACQMVDFQSQTEATESDTDTVTHSSPVTVQNLSIVFTDTNNTTPGHRETAEHTASGVARNISSSNEGNSLFARIGILGKAPSHLACVVVVVIH